MAAVLGIHKGDLKVVSVYEGSTIVDFMVISDPESEEEVVDLKTVQIVFEKFVQEVSKFMDSDILGAFTEDNLIYGEAFGDKANGFKYDDVIEKF